MRSNKNRPKFYILNPKFSKKGFTLIELALVVGIIALLTVVTFSALFTRKGRTDLDSTTRQIAGLLREAQSRALAQESSTAWGVYFSNITSTAPFYALYKNAYSAANAVSLYRLPLAVTYATSSLAQGATTTVVFSQISGLPTAAFSLTLRLTTGSAAVTSTITVASSGLVSF